MSLSFIQTNWKHTHAHSQQGYDLQALLKNARANSSRKGSIAALAPDADIGIGARGLLNRWTEMPAHKTFAQAYAEGSGCLNAAVAA